MLVLGASGVLGRRVVRLLQDRHPELDVVGGTRRANPGDGWVQVDLGDAASRSRALAGVDVCVNSVGPFRYDPEPLLTSCRAAGCDLVDLADDPEFLERLGGLAAAQADVRVIPGCSTVPALVESLATRWRDDERLTHLRALLSIGTNNPSSSALLYSLIRPLGRRAPDGVRYYARLERRRLAGNVSRLYGRYPAPFEAGGIHLGTSRVPATFLVGCDRDLLVHALSWGSPLTKHLPNAFLHALCKLTLPVTWLLAPLGSLLGILRLEAVDESGEVFDSLEVRAQSEGLDVPALPAVWAAGRLANDRTHGRHGLTHLPDLLDWTEAREELETAGFEVRDHATP